MNISKTRLAIRLVLIALILLVTLVGYRAWRINSPGHFLRRAELALQAGDAAAAKLHLQNCVQRHPQDGAAHFALAQLLLREHQAEHPAAQFAHHGAAMQHLAAAGGAMPRNGEVQEILLQNLLLAGRQEDAMVVAKRLHEVDPQHALALVTIARGALQTRRFHEAVAALDALDQQDHPHPYRTLFLRSELHRLQENADRRAEIVRSAVARAGQLDEDQWRQLTLDERVSLRSLLAAAVAVADDVDQAHQLAGGALRIYEFSQDAKGAVRLAINLRDQYPVGSLEAPQQEVRGKLLARAEATAAEAVKEAQRRLAEREPAPDGEEPPARRRPDYPEPAIYSFLAERQFEQGYDEDGLETLQAGLVAASQYPDAYLNDILNVKLQLASRLISRGEFVAARPFLDELASHDITRTQGLILAGSVALAEMRYHDALSHFQAAEKHYGPTLNLELALATTHVALDNWQAALPHLEYVMQRLGDLTDAQQTWLGRHLGDENKLREYYVRALVAADRMEEAEPQARALIGTSRDPDVRTMLAAQHWKAGRHGRAVKILTKAHADYPDNPSILLTLAMATHKQGFVGHAERLVRRYVDEAPEDLYRQLIQVQWDLIKGEVDLALVRIQELKSQHDSPLLPLIEAQLQLVRGDLKEAAQLAHGMQQSDEWQLSGTLIEAEVAIRQGELEKIAQLLEQEFAQPGLENAGSPGAVSLAKARLQASSGDPRAAAATVANVLPFETVAPRARLVLIHAVEQVADQEGLPVAEQLLAELNEAHPDQAIILLLHARYAMFSGKHELAEQQIKQLMQLEPHSPVTSFLRGQNLVLLNKHREALQSLKASIRIAPDYLPSRVLAAEICLHLGDYDQAAEQAKEVLVRDPDHLQASLAGSQALARMDQDLEAIKMLRDLLHAAPGHIEASLRLAQLYADRKQPELALQVMRVARQKNPGEASLAEQEVLLAARVQSIDVAEQVAREFFHETLEDDRTARFAQAEKFARMFLDLRAYDVARGWADSMQQAAAAGQAVEVSWLRSNIDLVEGRSDGDASLLEAAVGHLRDVLSDSPDHAGARNNLALLLAEDLDQPEEAVAIVEAIRRDQPQSSYSVWTIEMMANVYQAAGRTDEARKLLTEGVGRHPLAAGLQLQLGMLLAKQGEAAAARERLATAVRIGLSREQRLRAEAEIKRLQLPAADVIRKRAIIVPSMTGPTAEPAGAQE